MEYIDKWGRYHHKPVTDIKPVPSNNGWIYTAYAQKLGLDIEWMLLGLCFKQCKVINSAGKEVLIRSPGKDLPPISRDEILGLAALDLLKEKHIPNWNFSPEPIPKFNLVKLVKQLLELRGKHRNYFWENKLDQMYQFAYSVPLADRYFIQKQWGDFNPIYWAIAKIDSIICKKDGISWLKYDSSLEKMQEEFPVGHPFRSVK